MLLFPIRNPSKGMDGVVCKFFASKMANETGTQRAATPDAIAQMRGLVADAMDAGAVGFATSVSKIHIGYGGLPVPSRLTGFDKMLAIADALAAAGRGVFHYNVGRDRRWDEYAALHQRSGRPVVWTALLAGSLGPGSHVAQLRKAAEQRARLADLPAGRVPADPDRIRFPLAGDLRYLSLLRSTAQGRQPRCRPRGLRRSGVPGARAAAGRRQRPR